MGQALVQQGTLLKLFERSGFEVEELAKKVGVSPERVDQWLFEGMRPTFKQAEKIAKVLRVPFGYLFLRELPVDQVQIPDLRTVGSTQPAGLDANFQALLSDVLFKRDWFVEYRESIGFEPLPFVGKFDLNSDPVVVARDIAQQLGVPRDRRGSNGSWEDFLNQLIAQAEAIGIWVMRSGVVGNNTSRPLSVEQFRGFAISHKLAPLVFINGRDAKAAQIFSFAHELAHLWLGESGVSNSSLVPAATFGHKRVEALCNSIAAEFLVPADHFRETWVEEADLLENSVKASRDYRVSQIVAVRRAFDLGMVTERQYLEFAAEQQRVWAKRPQGSGGNFYATVPVRNGKSFTTSVVSQAMSGQVLLRNAARLLNVQPSSVMKLGRE